MKRILFLTVLAAAAFAQSTQAGEAPLAPPKAKVDKALRQRITEFYRLQVDGKYREAEALVADDTKDYYYASGKTSLLSFEIKNISYFDKYKHATAVLSTQRYLRHPEFAGHPMTSPLTSTWKLERGKWVWYVDPETLRQTPLGIPKPAGAPNAASGPPQPFPVMPGGLGLAGKVRADRSALALKPGESGEIVFSSAAPGIAVVSLDGEPSGFQVSPNQVLIKQNESAKVTVKALGSGTAALRFRIDPTGETIEVSASAAK